jgi:hypothetical protein
MPTPINPSAEGEHTPELLTAREMAKAARCSLRSVAEWRAKKKGPPFVRVGNRVLYPAGEARSWLLRNRTEA